MSFDYSVVLNDPTGIGGAADALLVADLGAALADWSQYITGAGTLVASLGFLTTPSGTANGGAAVYVADGAREPDGAAETEPSTVYELLNGRHVTGYASDLSITINPSYLPQLYLNPDPAIRDTVPAGKVDAISTMLHEVAHALGFSGYYDQTGVLTSGGAAETRYDRYIDIAADGTASFTGPTAEAVFGGPAPLTTNNPPENYYHLSNVRTGPLGRDLENGQVTFTGYAYDISNLDLAILKDSGVPVTSGLGGAVLCFSAGTRIRTPDGDVAVEALRPGDLVVTVGPGSPDARPVVWTGRRRVDASAHPRPEQVRPVRVAAGAFGAGAPARDLLLSPDHAVFAAGVLIPVKHLIDGDAVARVGSDRVTYVHIELDRHDVVLAEGLPAESLLPSASRDGFDGGGPVIRLHPDFWTRAWDAEGCAPLVLAGPEVDRVRLMLKQRAGLPRAARRRVRTFGG